MEILFHVSCPEAKPLLAGLAAACHRAGAPYGCFFTNDGVRVLDDGDIVALLAGATRAVVCEHSWSAHMGKADCPVETGSQTVNSAMMAEARRVVSL
jgi:hypothetical protein